MRNAYFPGSRPRNVLLHRLALALLVLVLLALTVAFLGVFWLPLLLLVLVVAVSLWAVRKYYLDDLEEPERGGTER